MSSFEFKDLVKRLGIIAEASRSPYTPYHDAFKPITSTIRSAGHSSAPLDTITFIRNILFNLDIITHEEVITARKTFGFTGKKQALLSLLETNKDEINKRGAEIATAVEAGLAGFISGTTVDRGREEKYAAQAAARQVEKEMRAAKSGKKKLDDALEDVLDDSILILSAVAKVLGDIEVNLGDPGFEIEPAALDEVFEMADKVTTIDKLESFIRQLGAEPGYEKIGAYLSSALKPLKSGATAAEDYEEIEDPEDPAMQDLANVGVEEVYPDDEDLSQIEDEEHSDLTDEDISDEQYDYINDKFGEEAAKTANYGWIVNDGPHYNSPMLYTTKIYDIGTLTSSIKKGKVVHQLSEGPLREGRSTEDPRLRMPPPDYDNERAYESGDENPPLHELDRAMSKLGFRGDPDLSKSTLEDVIVLYSYGEGDVEAGKLTDGKWFARDSYTFDEFDSFEEMLPAAEHMTQGFNQEEDAEEKTPMLSYKCAKCGSITKRAENPASSLQRKTIGCEKCDDTAQLTEDEETVTESYISGYLSEQIAKDKLCGPKPDPNITFKERYKPTTSWQLSELDSYGM